MTCHFLPKASEQLCTSHSEQSVTVHTRTLDRPCSCPCSLPRTHTHPTWMVNLSPVLDSGQGPGICLGLWDNSWQASSRANKGQTNTPSSTLLLLLLPAEGPAQARPPVFTEARATEPLAKPSLQRATSGQAQTGPLQMCHKLSTSNGYLPGYSAITPCLTQCLLIPADVIIQPRPWAWGALP